MTVVDSSAVVAVLLAEPEAADYATALEEIEPLFMSAGTMLEVGTVLLHRQGADLIAAFFRLLDLAQIEIVPVSQDQVRTAIQAYARFGRGSGHSARLNYGDCFSYALAKTLDEPLLYKGDEFAHTDIRSAL